MNNVSISHRYGSTKRTINATILSEHERFQSLIGTVQRKLSGCIR